MEELEQNKKEAEQSLSSKEQYDLRKKEKEEAKKRERVKGKINETPKKVVKYVFYTFITVGVIGGLGWFVVSLSSNLPPMVQENHVEDSPPAHILTQPIPERIQRHMLEHADGSGAPGILIQYNCDDYKCEALMIEKLTSLVREYPDNVYLAPNEYDGKIILTKLGRREILDSFDATKISDFIK